MSVLYLGNTLINSLFNGSDRVKGSRLSGYSFSFYSGEQPTPTPCFDVTSNIATYTSTTFSDVYDSTADKWYKLNNLNLYEEYGIYGSGRTSSVTTYDGKLTIDGDYEYEYSGGSWVNVGEVTGTSATLPNVDFTLNYNAKNFDSTTNTLQKTNGQLCDVDGVINVATVTDHSEDGYITINGSNSNTYGVIFSGYQNYFNRDSNNPTLTVIARAKTNGTSCHLLANRYSSYNWMFRAYSDRLTLHGNRETGSIAISSTQADIFSVRVNSSSQVYYNNWTSGTSTSTSAFTYGSTNSNSSSLFNGYGGFNNSEIFRGDFYWIYMSQTELTDAQMQSVIDYNEEGGSQELPIYYQEKSTPPNHLVFSTMEEANAYQCPWYGMQATIGGVAYMFCTNNQWMTVVDYQEVVGEYICYGGDKYKKMQEYDRNVDGTTTATSVYVRGDLIESGSSDCTAKTENFTILDIGSSASTSSLSDGDFIVISYKNNNNPTLPSCMMSYTTSDNRVSNFSGRTMSNTIDSSTIIDAAVWQLEATSSADTYYVKNVERGLYWGYQDNSTNHSFQLVDSSLKSPILFDDYNGCIGLIEKIYGIPSYFGGYGLNQLYGYTYLLNWLNNSGTSEDSFYGSDGNALYVVYKIG